MLLVLSGCGGIKRHYPTWPVPERPEIAFANEGEHCLAEKDIRQLNEYVLRLEGTVHKYEMEINIINAGGSE